jgi:hypothetical protein
VVGTFVAGNHFHLLQGNNGGHGDVPDGIGNPSEYRWNIAQAKNHEVVMSAWKSRQKAVNVSELIIAWNCVAYHKYIIYFI